MCNWTCVFIAGMLCMCMVQAAAVTCTSLAHSGLVTYVRVKVGT